MNRVRVFDYPRLSFCVLAVACVWMRGPVQAAPQSPAAGDVPSSMSDSVGIRLQLIPAGSVTLGSASNAAFAEPEERPEHTVQIPEAYYIGVTEVTQQQWYAVMGTRPWRTPWNTPQLYVTEGDNYPASWITWREARAFCERLSEKEAASYRLPTEAEWERACRNGTAAAWSFGDDASTAAENGWFRENTVSDMHTLKPREVAARAPNSAGLYDMHGNVSEWCRDTFSDYPLSASAGQGSSLGVLRGGSWFVSHNHSRAATRDRLRQRQSLGSTGLRVVRELRAAEPAPAPPQPETPAPQPSSPAPAPPAPATASGTPAGGGDSSGSEAVENVTGNAAGAPGAVVIPCEPGLPGGSYNRVPRCRIPLIPIFR